MRSPQEEIETVRTMAETMMKIDTVLHEPVDNYPEVNITQADDRIVEITDENFEQIEVDGAESWWNTWCEIRDILDEAFEGDIEGGESVTMSEHEPNGNMRIGNDFMSIGIRLYNGVGVQFVAEYRLEESDTWRPLYEGELAHGGFEQLTRNVVRAELAIIAAATQSAAETIDYWMTEMDGYQSWTQSSWAETRGVGRQTVNDRVRSAVENVED